MFNYTTKIERYELPAGGEILLSSRLVSGHFGRWGFTWRTPQGVTLQRGGQTITRPIPDVTRLAQIAIWTAAGLAWLIHRSFSK